MGKERGSAERPSAPFAAGHGGNIQRKRRSGSCWKAYAARRVLPNCAAAKELRKACTISGARNLEAGKARLAGDAKRQATSSEVTELRQENDQLKQAVADLLLQNRVLKKSVLGSESGWDD